MTEPSALFRLQTKNQISLYENHLLASAKSRYLFNPNRGLR